MTPPRGAGRPGRGRPGDRTGGSGSGSSRSDRSGSGRSDRTGGSRSGGGAGSGRGSGGSNRGGSGDGGRRSGAGGPPRGGSGAGGRSRGAAGGSPRPDRAAPGGGGGGSDRPPASDQAGGSRPGRGEDGPSGGDRSGRRGGRTASPGGSRRPTPGGRGTRPSAPRGLGGEQVEGRQAVRELLLAGRRRVREVLLAAEMDQADVIDDIIELARDQKITVREISRRSFDAEARTQAAQGVLARCAGLKEFDLDDLGRKRGAFVLVLDGVTDPQNLGALLRTAECAGVTGVVLPRHRSVHVTPTVTKAAAGAIEHLPMALVGGVPAALGRLQQLGVTTIGLDAGGRTSVFDLPLDPDTPVALVLGAEGAGLSRLVRERVDLLASIPMGGQLNSLNVAMAGGVACFEVVRLRQASSRGEGPDHSG